MGEIDKDAVAFTCYAFGDRYIEQQVRLKESILKIYPDAPLFFYTTTPPPHSRTFDESQYGFKPHCVQACLDAGYKKIIFFDPAMILMDKVDYYDSLVKRYGVIAVQDDNKLTAYTSDKCLQYFEINREYISDKHLVGGSFYYFDFNLPLCQKIFSDWKKSEDDGMFGSTVEFCSIEGLQGHRSDETCMAICLYKNGSFPTPYTGSRYNWDSQKISRKEHFK